MKLSDNVRRQDTVDPVHATDSKVKRSADMTANRSGEGGNWLRMPLVMPVAAGLTLGLMLSMANMIAAEFQPQDKSKSVTFDINPVEDILEIRDLIDEPDSYEKVETPPPPPSVATDVVDQVQEPVVKLVAAVPDINLPPLELNAGTYTQPDTHEQPLVRIPPIMPARFQQGDVSGYCRMRFSVSPEGQPFDVTVTQCTDSMLERPSKKAVLKWKYAPKIQNGRAVSRSGVETKIRFDLADERGKRLPLPSGY